MNALTALVDQLGAQRIVAASDRDTERHRRDYGVSMPYAQTPAAVAYPTSTQEVATILATCHHFRQRVTVQGGMTGLVGGAVPAKDDLVLSLERLRDIEEIDLAASTMTVQAGVPLETVQRAAAEADLFFPLDLGARGSCTIGGNVATNAGGGRVLRYGMMRDLVVGLEVVLADGTTVTSLNKLLKNNAGYDVKHLFIGSEGTLGVVTRAVLRLHPRPAGVNTVLCGVRGYDQVLGLLHAARRQLEGTLSAFELMWPDFYDYATTGQEQRQPLVNAHGLYVLLEGLGSGTAADRARFEAFLETAYEQDLIADAVLAKTAAESGVIWKIREASAEFQRNFSPRVDFDVGIPIADIGRFVVACRAALLARFPDARAIFFGHVGDGNIHIAVNLPALQHDSNLEGAVEHLVYAAVQKDRGTISAEHGIGTAKRAYLHFSRSDAELALMRTLKVALDPHGILNHGKILEGSCS